MKNWLGRAFSRAAIETPPDTKSATYSPSGSQPLVALHLSSRAHWTGRDYGALAREGYQKNAVVYRCVRLISEAAASILYARAVIKNASAATPQRRSSRAVIP